MVKMQKLIKSDRDDTFIISEIDRTFRNRIRKYIYADIVILLFCLPIGGIGFTVAGSAADIFKGICYTVTFIALNVGVVMLISNHCIKKRNAFVQWFLETDSEYYEKMCSQAELVGLLYGSFYLLDDYLLVLDDMLMIPFNAVRGVTVYRYCSRRFFFKFVRLHFAVTGRKNVSVEIKKIRDFEDSGDNFIRSLESKIKNAK